ncbi:auxin-responsive protein IAA18-like [Panicum miliaceum]|uniref:Auxin-responsive protein n=1 Tax=Panicum miliaceum TaxID=4540 RepID=A0A3L6STR0_PANMI|nr:auxin-responsive protein IAA18-like [Panicum miliaceum]
MEEDSRGRAPSTPQLLNLIRGGGEWKAADGGRSSRTTTCSEAEEDTKLELKLGLPGVPDEERPAGPREKMQQEQGSCTALSLGCFPSHSRLAASTATATGAKRGFLATVGAKAEGCNQRHQDRQGCGNELTLGDENMAGERKKGCCPPSSSHDSAAGPVRSSSSNPHQGRGAVLPVVGWPPVRAIRRNLTNGSSSKQSPDRQNDEAGDKAKLTCKRSPLVKINMDGIPIGRKIDLAAYDNYQKLSSAVQELFSGFLEAQKDLDCTKSGEQGTEEKLFSGLFDGNGEYILVYEDDGGSRTPVGDLPWNVFVSTAKRLRVMKSSELPHGIMEIFTAMLPALELGTNERSLSLDHF